MYTVYHRYAKVQYKVLNSAEGQYGKLSSLAAKEELLICAGVHMCSASSCNTSIPVLHVQYVLAVSTLILLLLAFTNFSVFKFGLFSTY